MEKELKEGQRVTQKKLERKGWGKIGPYLGFVVFHKDEKTLFFDPESGKIDQIF